jgi:hypothetical protein
MNSLRSFLKWLLIFPVLFLAQPKAIPQHSEIGVKVILSGALMFGPYYTCWIDDHNALNASILAAYEKSIVFPFALNASYNAYFFDNKWRPELGVQYSYLITPRKSKSSGDPDGISLLSLVPGVQFQWDDSKQNVQGSVWLAHFLDKKHKSERFKIFPVGIDFSYGYKFLHAAD